MVDYEWLIRAYIEERLTRYKSCGRIVDIEITDSLVTLYYELQFKVYKFPIIKSMRPLVTELLEARRVK